MQDKPQFTVVNSNATKVLSVRIPTTDYLRFYANADKSGLTMSEYLQLKLYAEQHDSHAQDSLQITQVELEKLTKERDYLLLNGSDSAKKLITVVRQLTESQAENDRLNELLLEAENGTKEQIAAENESLQAEISELIGTIQEMQELVKSLELSATQNTISCNEAVKKIIFDIDSRWEKPQQKFRDETFMKFQKIQINLLVKLQEGAHDTETPTEGEGENE